MAEINMAKETGWKPTHMMVDEDGEECGEYMRDGNHWVDEDVWCFGGRPLRESERVELGWTAQPLEAE